MSRETFFAKLGVLIIPGFLPADDCDRVRAEMRAAPHTDALVSVRGREAEAVDLQRRKTVLAQVSDQTRAFIVSRLRSSKPSFEQFFGEPFADLVEAPKFLIYHEGDFFVPHRDVFSGDVTVSSPVIKARRVNLVLSLNRETPSGADGYAGAALTLYGLIDQPQWKAYGFPVPAEPGLLVAFRSEVLHEVAPILGGERYNVVSRLLDPSFRPSTSDAAVDGSPDASA
jgi:SM-20-related protein